MQRTYERQAGRKKELYILSLDSGRLFWVVVISLLVLAFLFLLGYWIGHDTVSAGANIYARDPGFDDARGNTGAHSLRSELDRIGQLDRGIAGNGVNGVNGVNDVKEGGLGGTTLIVQVGEDEKSPVNGAFTESFATKTEKNEFDTLKQSKTASPVHKQQQQTAAASSPKPSTVVKKSESGTAALSPAAKMDGKYLVQVASLSSRTSAENLSKNLAKKQYQPSIMETVVNGKDYFRVRVGGYESYDAAARALRSLQDSGEGSGCYIVQQ